MTSEEVISEIVENFYFNFRPLGATVTEVNATSIARAIEVANELREKFGEDRIDDLPKGKIAVPKKCVLARAFNFNCWVNGAYTWSETGIPTLHWYAHFTKEQEPQAKALAEVLETEAAPNTYFDGSNTIEGWKVVLPEDIGAIALAFDDHRLPQYVEGPEDTF